MENSKNRKKSYSQKFALEISLPCNCNYCYTFFNFQIWKYSLKSKSKKKVQICKWYASLGTLLLCEFLSIWCRINIILIPQTMESQFLDLSRYWRHPWSWPKARDFLSEGVQGKEKHSHTFLMVSLYDLSNWILLPFFVLHKF